MFVLFNGNARLQQSRSISIFNIALITPEYQILDDKSERNSLKKCDMNARR